MPVTFQVASHAASVAKYRPAATAHELLAGTGARLKYTGATVMESSFDEQCPFQGSIQPSTNGLACSAINAYNNHQNLILRPDDVWITIQSQLSFYINAHAEELRSLFVSHEGQKDLLVEVDDALGSTETFISHMTTLISREIRDASFAEWIKPDFRTTTAVDRTVCSAMLMGSMQKYFTYTMDVICGIPQVTLLGERDDWVKLRAKLTRLEGFGKEPRAWSRMLYTILTECILAFDKPKSQRTRDFWSRIAHFNPNSSGTPWWSGWITAFCFWDAEGHCLAPAERLAMLNDMAIDAGQRGDDVLGVRLETIPVAFAEVPVTVTGKGPTFQALLVAGSVGELYIRGGKDEDYDVKSVQPLAAWWFIKPDPAAAHFADEPLLPEF